MLAVELHGKASSTEAQQQWALAGVRKPVIDTDRFERVWSRSRRSRRLSDEPVTMS